MVYIIIMMMRGHKTQPKNQSNYKGIPQPFLEVLSSLFSEDITNAECPFFEREESKK